MTRLATILALCATTAAAEAPRLSFPVDCTLDETCFIQNYVDRDPGPGHTDFGCGALSYDGHKGTDFSLHSIAAMQDGVDVLAAAPGRVRGLRDGMVDQVFTAEATEALDGRDCGNGVLIEHGDGWQTQYCHMKRGSIAVEQGQTVKTGDILGQIGLSGRTQFPHLHISVRQDGQIVDPFQPEGGNACGETGNALWSDSIRYTAGGLITAGFSPGLPDYTDIKAGSAGTDQVQNTADALVLWVYLFGGREGDRIAFRIDGARGVFLEQEAELTKSQAQLFRAAGRKRKAAFWTDGDYTGTATLLRDGVEIDRITASVTVNR